MKFLALYVCIAALILLTACADQPESNSHYPVNKVPLKQTAFVKLPLGAIRADGWLKNQLLAQKDGLTGHLEDFWPDLKNSAWKGLGGEAWERGPYYLDGLIPLAYLLEDSALIKKSQIWIEWILQSAKDNGWFGPEKNSDRWPLAVAAKDLMQYYEATGDERVLLLLTNYFHYLDNSPPDLPNDTWRGVRAMENAVIGYWLYRQTADKQILSAIKSVQENSFKWNDYFSEFPWDSLAAAEGKIPHNWKADGLTAHVVNNAMAIKYPGLWFQQSLDEQYRYSVFSAIQKYDLHHGQVGGRFSGDEHLSGKNPTQGSELCSIVEYMFSLEQLIEVLGDISLADRLEVLAYNALPATITPDYWAHQYNQQANQVQVSRDKRQWSTNGDESNIFGLMPNYPCCLANMHQGWPKFVQTMWMATHDNGVALINYGPNSITVKVADGRKIMIKQITEYPFRDTVKLQIETGAPVKFPLYLRIPSWAENVTVSAAEKNWQGKAGTMLKVDKEWKNGEIVEVDFSFNIRTETRYNKSLSILRGPLYFALRIGKTYNTIQATAEHTQSISYRGSRDWEIHPTTDWNYALKIDHSQPEKNIKVVHHPLKRLPFADIGEKIYDGRNDEFITWPYEAPVVLEIPAFKVHDWKMVHNSVDQIPQSPRQVGVEGEMVQLTPYGSARLRISEFPRLIETKVEMQDEN